MESNRPNIILASASPRRKALLEMLGVPDLTVIPAKGEETIDPSLTPAELVKTLSRQKAAEVAAEVAAEDAPEDAVVIGADTVVVLDGAVLGKPKDKADAKRMLSALSGRSHTVWTGITAIRGDTSLSRAERTEVFFRPLSGREIDAYIVTGGPLDKAGAYGAQDLASLFVERIDGDFFNVVGLPLCALGKLLKERGVDLI